ncbi:MAG: hypothetical protein Q8K45_16940 [Rubrivivax sp.]|nr:hypothetical protein [Rubrivivax sp.]
MKTLWTLGGLAIVAALSACGERPQVAGKRTVGAAANLGTGGGPYTAPGWKAGDETSWEEHMRTRTQSGQNEYVRSAGK